MAIVDLLVVAIMVDFLTLLGLLACFVGVMDSWLLVHLSITRPVEPATSIRGGLPSSGR